MTTFVNQHNGHRRKVNGFTAFLGSALLGPFYFLLKGAWPTFLVLWFVFAIIFTILFALTMGFAPLALLMLAMANLVIVSPFAAFLVRRHYRSRGFEKQSEVK
ncbi:hypothetical protein V3589_15065 [Sinorhizobium fredii]|uniref:hypothetical protein n=1 Tax=Rhizobium fredii TaxID=380 RepID=UPI00309A6D86